MNFNEIKSAIKAMPDSDVWDRQIQRDFADMGPEQFAAALTEGMEQADDPKRQAALRLLNTLRLNSAADREQCVRDFETLLGEPL